MTTELKTKNKLNEIGGVEHLTELIDYVPTAANVDYYIKLVSKLKRVVKRLKFLKIFYLLYLMFKECYGSN